MPPKRSLFSQSIKDIYFEYDKADLRGDQQASIQADAQFLGQHSGINFTLKVTAMSADPRSTTWR